MKLQKPLWHHQVVSIMPQIRNWSLYINIYSWDTFFVWILSLICFISKSIFLLLMLEVPIVQFIGDEPDYCGRIILFVCYFSSYSTIFQLYDHSQILSVEERNRIHYTMYLGSDHRPSASILFWVTRAILQLSGDCHHCRRQGCKFRPMLSAYGF
jgi:hypothetical protein